MSSNSVVCLDSEMFLWNYSCAGILGICFGRYRKDRCESIGPFVIIPKIFNQKLPIFSIIGLVFLISSSQCFAPQSCYSYREGYKYNCKQLKKAITQMDDGFLLQYYKNPVCSVHIGSPSLGHKVYQSRPYSYTNTGSLLFRSFKS